MKWEAWRIRLAVTSIDRLLVKAKPRAIRRDPHVKSCVAGNGKISVLLGTDKSCAIWTSGVISNKIQVNATNAAI